MGAGSSNSFDDFAAQFYPVGRCWLNRAVLVEPMKPALKPPGTKRFKLEYGVLLSNFAFHFNLRRYIPAIRAAGLIIDVRRNAGGNIDTWILERLRRVAWMFNTGRSGPGDTTMQYAFSGKVAVIVDEMTSSDAEIFAAGIQQLKLGAVIGMRSWGGAVGYSGNPELALVDGSGFTIPSFGPYAGSAAGAASGPAGSSANRWMIEQQGVVPDIVVANPPVATFHGEDAQLDAAIDHLLGLLAGAYTRPLFSST